MPVKPKLRSRYCIKMQGLFSGVEWSVLRDGKVVSSGESPDVESGLDAARFAYRRDRFSRIKKRQRVQVASAVKY